MLGQIFSTLGGMLGGHFGGGILSTVGRFAGSRLGTYLEQSIEEPEEFYRFHRHLDKLYLESSAAGHPIPLAFGRVKLSGHMIWALPLKEIMNEAVEVRKFRASDLPRTVVHDNSYTYYATFALAICAGEITEISRVWAGGELVDISKYSFCLYRGAKDQMPDPIIEAAQGVGKTPGFRDLAYIVFENLPLEEFGNRVPNFSFEILRKTGTLGVEEMIQDMVVIPGSGEFVYDTIVQEKISHTDGVRLIRDPINCHNYAGIADSLFSLNQLQTTCSNLKWVAPVVCWFGDSTQAGQCKVVPRVEWNDAGTSTSEEWYVAGRTRGTAQLVSRDDAGNPNYGGTVNDASVLRYLDEIRSRGLKIMFYPMFFLDVPGKPWRGHITGSSEDVVAFFNKPEGYKNFILHYAQLVRGKVDAFVVGSELIGLTKVRSGEHFPAVHELVDLARQVKAILGSDTLVTYAADWSEYHHTEGGWYNMDELWACEAIDFVGIDAYFPITDSQKSNISAEEIAAGWTKGEGWDFYRDEMGVQQPLDSPWAWKNIGWWWANSHVNPNGQQTQWIPRSKKIWFTEFGFPSIDKAPNQPNVFFDPLCVDGGAPRHSTGDVDFSIQRRALKASLEVLQEFEFLEQKFIWTWDARPYPAWPYSSAWRDGRLWSHGHWVNNKLGAASLGGILLELCARAGIKADDVNVASVDEMVGGLALSQNGSILDAINMLRVGYFFDIVAGDDKAVRFVSRQSAASLGPNTKLSAEVFIKSRGGSFVDISEIPDVESLTKVMIKFIDQKSYAEKACYHNIDTLSNRLTEVLSLPLSMSESEAVYLADRIIKSSKSEKRFLKFSLPINYLNLEPADVINMQYAGKEYTLRITDIIVKGLVVEIAGVSL